MKDEKYLYIQDVREKSITARSARSRWTRGGVKLPSDYMTEKEKQKMNGEEKVYRMNKPMNWDEFKSMPDDLKIIYIKAIRKKYNAPDAQIARMLGVTPTPVSVEFRRLGIGAGKTKGRCTAWDKDGFLAWIGDVPVPTADPVEATSTETPEPEQHEEPVADPVVETKTESTEKLKAIPKSGSMTFEGSVEAVLNSVRDLLDGEHVRISITWCKEV